MAIVELSVVPIGTADPSVSNYVSAIQKALAEEDDIRFILTPMSTVLEGELDVLWPIIRKVMEIPFNKGALRVYTTLKVDDRRDKKSTMEGKVASVWQKVKD